MNLENNHEQMKTVVETFIIEETAPLIYDNEQLSAWNRHVEELGLKGQTKIVTKEKSPIPFMYMNSSVIAILETLCPRKVKVEDYSATPIPIEILGLVALAKRESHFDYIEIWYDEKSPDPACVGFLYSSDEDRKRGYTWGGARYLLGKWGDVKQTFEELKQRAIKRYRIEQTVQNNNQIRYYERKNADLEEEIVNKFGAGVEPF